MLSGRPEVPPAFTGIMELEGKPSYSLYNVNYISPYGKMKQKYFLQSIFFRANKNYDII
jgi:hypothetical protein